MLDKVFGWCAKIKRLWSPYLLGFWQEQGIFVSPVRRVFAVPIGVPFEALCRFFFCNLLFYLVALQGLEPRTRGL